MDHADGGEARAIEAAREQWRERVPSGDRWLDWSALRGLLFARWERQHRAEDLEEIIQNDLDLLLKPSLKGLNLEHHAVRLACLALAYSNRCQRTLASTDNAREIYFGRLALALLPKGRPNIEAVMRSQLSRSLLTRADEKADMKTMNEAMDQAASALALNTIRTGINYQEKLDTLANVFRQRFLLNGDPADLEQSIDVLEQETGLNVGDASGIYVNLSYSLSLRYELLGNANDLDRAIELGFKALDGPHVSLESIVDRSRNLVDFLEIRYNAYGESADIQLAKVLLRPLVSRLSPDSSRYAGLCQTLSKLLRISSEASNSLEELNAAVEIARKGALVTKAPLRTKRTARNELGLLLAARHGRIGLEYDAHDALRSYQSALDLEPITDETRALITANMACTYDDLYQSTKMIKYLRQGYELSLQAIRLSKARANSNAWLNAANQCYRLYTADDSQVAYLSQGINLIHEGLGFTHKTKSSQWSQMCLSAGLLYELKYRRTAETEDFTSALVMYVETWRIKTAPLVKRLKAINLACDLLIQKERWSEAWEFLQDAVKLVPLYYASSPDQRDQQYMISDLSGITAQACTAGLVVGEMTRALELWEQGRGMVVASSYNAVAELSRLQKEQPSLYSTFVKRRIAAFEAPSGVHDSSQNSLDNAYLSRNQMIVDSRAHLDAVVEEIRQCDGFQDFLRPMTVNRMQHLAGEGAIVVLNTSQHRTHAILLTRSRIDSLELKNPPEQPELFQRLDSVMRVVMADLSVPKCDKSLDMTRANRNMMALLYKLWNSIAQPICNALGLTRVRLTAKMYESPPNIGACRIRWLTSGGFSRLPLHAAGIWAGSCNDVLMKYAFSSYAASFRVLEYASEKANGIETTGLRGLLVSMERPPPDHHYHRKHWFIKTAQQESQLVQSAHTNIKWSTLVRPSSQTVLEELPKHTLAHFATHGVSDPKDPLKSHLILMNTASNDHTSSALKRDNLSVPDIFRCTSDNAILAFLAACYSADSQNPKLADENLHIANAFQIAGFPHVIGSLWPASEFVCPMFARTFYEGLARWGGELSLSNDLLAFAAHYAVGVLIRDYINEPRLWAGFVHFGP